MAEETDKTNILRNQGALLLIAEELRRDLGTYNIRADMLETERLSLNERMTALGRMISEVRS